MSDFYNVFINNKFKLFMVYLISTPISYYLGYFFSYMFFMFFGEVIQLTYIRILFSSVLPSLCGLLVFSKFTGSLESSVISYYFFAFLFPFILITLLVGSIVISFGLII